MLQVVDMYTLLFTSQKGKRNLFFQEAQYIEKRLI